MTELTANDFVSRIEQEEYQAISWDNKLFGLTSWIYTTKELAKEFHPKKPLPVEKIFVPNKLNKILLLIVAVVFPIFLLYSIATTKGVKSYAYFIAIPFLILLVLAIRTALRSKSLNYSINLTKEVLQVGDCRYHWNDIQEAFIVIRPKQRGTNPFLLIGLTNGNLDRYDLTNLMGLNPTDKELAATIEYYRKNYAEQKVSYKFN